MKMIREILTTRFFAAMTIFLFVCLDHSKLAAQPEVTIENSAITIKFSEETHIKLRRQGSGVAGIQQVVISNREILSNHNEIPIPSFALEMFRAVNMAPVTDWPAYLLERGANGGHWPSRGSRERYQIALDTVKYQAHGIDGDVVTLEFQIQHGSHAGRLDLIYEPVNVNLAGFCSPGIFSLARPVYNPRRNQCPGDCIPPRFGTADTIRGTLRRRGFYESRARRKSPTSKRYGNTGFIGFGRRPQGAGTT